MVVKGLLVARVLKKYFLICRCIMGLGRVVVWDYFLLATLSGSGA